MVNPRQENRRIMTASDSGIYDLIDILPGNYRQPAIDPNDSVIAYVPDGKGGEFAVTESRMRQLEAISRSGEDIPTI